MSLVLVTGSAGGLGRRSAESLLDAGHEVVVHARSSERAEVLEPLLARGARLVVADLAVRDDVLALADELGGVGLDAVIHNAGVMSGPAVMPVNVVAPYLLTALLPAPRLVYLSSSMHRGGRDGLDGVDWTGATEGDYSQSKLYVTALAAAVARLRPDVVSSAVDPGWVPTRMGGPSAPDDLEAGHETQDWLATSDDPAAGENGGYWHHRARRSAHPLAADEGFQRRLLASLAAATGIRLDRE